MSDLRSWLERTDLSRLEEDLSEHDVTAMRQRIAAVQPAAQRDRRQFSLVIGLTLICAVVVAVGLTRRRVSSQPSLPSSDQTAARSAPSVRTVQFVTYGGTRVFWTFHP